MIDPIVPVERQETIDLVETYVCRGQAGIDQSKEREIGYELRDRGFGATSFRDVMRRHVRDEAARLISGLEHETSNVVPEKPELEVPGDDSLCAARGCAFGFFIGSVMWALFLLLAVL